ncbi:MAG: PAS domain S-box protein [Candidatus Kapabacteria bacterium]|nr:PAS domain S-box protein [Candidatus Kapabacteria bacterium]MDW8011399.1 PAS domain S-box protein [Bacteroidota bacterium]
MERLTGWGSAKLHQSSIEDLFAPAAEYRSLSFAERVIQEGSVELDLQLRSQQQESLTIHGTIIPLRFLDDAPNGFLWFLRPAEGQEPGSQQSLHYQKLLLILESLLELRPMEELLSTTVQTLFSLLPLDSAIPYTREGDLLLSRWHTTSSPELTAIARSTLPVERSLIGSALCRGSPAVFNNAHQHPHSYYPEGWTPPAVEHLISIPLRVGNQQAALGLARFTNPPFSAREAELALLFGRFVQIGLVNAELWQSLQRSEAHYRELLEWLPAPLILHREGKVLYANQVAADVLGLLSPQDLVGLPVLELVAPEERSTFREWIQDLQCAQYPALPPRYTRLLHRGGFHREVLISARIVTHGEAPAVLIVGVDITEQRRLQRQREWELAALRIVATAALHSQSISELCKYFLAQACRELGFRGGSIRLLEGNSLVPIAVIGLPPEAVPTVPLTDETTLAAFVARTRQPIFVPDIELYPLSEPHRRRLCELGVCAAVSYPIVGLQGQLLGTFQLVHHISLELGEGAREFFTILASSLGIAIERLRLEQQLRDSEHRFRTLAEHAPIAITRYGLHEGRYLFANREFERQSGYTLAEFEALSDRELIEMIHPEDRERVFRFWREWQRAGFPDVQCIDYRIYNRSGGVVWLDSYLYAERRSDGQLESIVQVCIDITPLKRAEEAFQQALQEDFRRTVQNLHGIVFRLQHRPDGTVFYALREGKLASSYTTATIYGRPIDELPESLRFPSELLERAFAGERVTIEVAHDDRWLLYTLEPLYSDGGTVAEVVGTGIDITERRLLERSLAESEHRYRSLVEALPVGVVEIFVSSDLSRQEDVYVNPAFTAIAGYTLEELSTVSGTATVHPEDRAAVEEAWEKWLNTPDAPPLRMVYRCFRKNGEPYWPGAFGCQSPTA